MVPIIEALRQKRVERVRDVIVPGIDGAPEVTCKLMRLGDAHYAVTTADSHNIAMQKVHEFNPRANGTFPMYKDIVEYLSEPTGKFFFTRKELEQLLKAGNYVFRIPTATTNNTGGNLV